MKEEILIASSSFDSKKKIKLVSVLPDGDEESLVAYAEVKRANSTATEEVVLGKINVATYEYIQHKVIIVPVNQSTTLSGPTVQTSLNQIYAQAVAGWQVTIDAVFEIDQNYLKDLDKDESGDFRSYNSKMRAFHRAYKRANNDYDRDAFYIFLIKGAGYQYKGFMPFNRGFGYIFIDNNTDIIKTIAHELGHGAFNLRHTFDEYPVAQSSTDNLMDYNSGTTLKKYQWDNIHNPESVISWLQDDEEGAMPCFGIFDDCNNVLKMLASIKDSYARKDSIVIKSPWDGPKQWRAKGLALDGTIFSEIVVSIDLPPNTSKKILASKYKNIDTLSGKGFVYERFNKVYALILIKDDTNKLSALRGALSSYLFGVEKQNENNVSNEILDKVRTAAKKAVDDVLTFKVQEDAACNLCVRAAILNLKNDPVLFPESGSYVFFTYDKEKDPVIKGVISGNGSASAIVSDFENLSASKLRDYFVEEKKNEIETYQQFWTRLQQSADQGGIIVGTYPGHVFMLVPGGLIDVINNSAHTKDGKLKEKYKIDPVLSEGDKYGFSFTAKRGIFKVPRTLECGVNVKSSNAPIYANMDYKGTTTKVKWFRYIK